MNVPGQQYRKVILLRSINVRKDHITGATIEEGQPITTRKVKGEEINILIPIAADLINAGSAKAKEDFRPGEIDALRKEHEAELAGHARLKKNEQAVTSAFLDNAQKGKKAA